MHTRGLSRSEHPTARGMRLGLDPVRAFELRLVKQIVVASASADGTGGGGEAFVRVEKIEQRPAIHAKLRILVQGTGGPKEKSVTVKQGADLATLSNDRAEYRDGHEVAEIYAEPGAEFIRFSNGRTLRLGAEIGGLREDVWRVQIKRTVEEPLKKEVRVRAARGVTGESAMKVLTLFFVDRVVNYRD